MQKCLVPAFLFLEESRLKYVGMAERLEKPEQLAAWLEEEDILFRLSPKEAQIMLGYLEGSGYSLEAGDG